MTRLPRIFVSIAAYREFDLVPTLRDCSARAAHPERLRFCICWQHEEDDSLAEFATDPRCDVIDVPSRESPGVSWARHAIQQRHRDEEYALQLDAHHRFVEGWDEILVDMLEGLRGRGVSKPVLTGYLPPFDPANDPGARLQAPCVSIFDRFSEDGIVFMCPAPLAGEASGPIPARFWCAHFSFAPGSFNHEVVLDPSGYFHGEEITMCVRAWTKGYDLFAPHRLVAWHEYTRRGRTCHWEDHPDWLSRHRSAIDAYRRLFGVDGVPSGDPGGYGLGTVRSLRQYERFAGLHFATRGVEPYTLTNAPPPDPRAPPADEDWLASLLRTLRCRVRLRREVVDPPGCASWRLILYAEGGRVLHVEDRARTDIDALLSSQPGDELTLTSPFTSRERATDWTLLLLDASRKRLGRVMGRL